MQDKCLNYKFILLMLFPLVGIIISQIFCYLIPYNGFSIIIFVSSLICAGLLLCFEPIAYTINQNEIRVICTFKQYRFSYNEIQQIILRFDALFELLFVKDYVLILSVQTKIPERCKRIVKSANTKKFIKEYYNQKMK